MELILQFVGEVLIQGLLDLGFRSLADVFGRRRNPVLSTLGSVLWGLIAGGLSLLIMPTAFIENPSLRLLNLLLTPVAVGAMMALLGRLRARRGALSFSSSTSATHSRSRSPWPWSDSSRRTNAAAA
jgi:hypothetical protein